MKNIFRVVLVLLAGISTFVSAMSFYSSPPHLYLGGSVVRSDWDAWQEAMKKFDGKIDTIVFHDSGGGDSFAGCRIGEDIRTRKFGTVVLGRCSSACANMFLGGVTRQYAEQKSRVHTVLGYHGGYSKVTKELNRRKSPDYFLKMTDGKISEEFVERFIRLEEQWEKRAGVDAPSKGVVTTWDTRDIPTPSSATREKITVKSWDTTAKPANPGIDELAGG